MTKDIKGSDRPEIDVDQIMAKIRAEVARRKGEIRGKKEQPKKENHQAVPGHRPEGIDHLDLNRFSKVQPLEYREGGYHLNDFLKYHDRDFVSNAYIGILKRGADLEGLNYYLENLRNGKLKKAEILGRIRYSPEGRAKKVKVRGLLVPFISQFLYKIPLFGYVFRLLNVIVRLPVIVKNVQSLDAYSQGKFFSIEDHLNILADSIQTKVNEIIEAQNGKADHSELEAVFSRKADRDDLEDIFSRLEKFDREKADLEEIKELLSSLERLEVNKSDRSELEAVASRKADLKEIEELGASKADRVDVESLVSQLEGLSDGKVDLSEMEAALSQKVDHAEIEELAASKADRNQVEDVRLRMEEFSEEKVNRSELEAVASQKADRTDVEKLASFKAERSELENLVNDNSKNVTHISYLRQSLVEQERRLGILLEETRKCLPEPLSTEQLQLISDEEEHLLDALYVSFEDKFRGTREEIKNRAGIYLPLIKESGAGTKDRPILDVGCGRGEWLELLKEEGLKARGVDNNHVMIEQCLKLKLDVSDGDAIAHLRNLPDASLGAVTGFHIIEHLPFTRLINLLDETIRVLKPDGIAIFETPNPKNIITRKINFYNDPTHIKILPSSMVKFVVESRGFCKVNIMEVNPSPEYNETERDSNNLMKELKELLYGPQDYSVIGYKA